LTSWWENIESLPWMDTYSMVNAVSPLHAASDILSQKDFVMYPNEQLPNKTDANQEGNTLNMFMVALVALFAMAALVFGGMWLSLLLKKQ
jgi:hypothetical protein